MTDPADRGRGPAIPELAASPPPFIDDPDPDIDPGDDEDDGVAEGFARCRGGGYRRSRRLRRMAAARTWRVL